MTMSSRRSFWTSRRAEQSVEKALLRVGPPWRLMGRALYGAFTKVTAASVETSVFTRKRFLEGLRDDAELHADKPEYTAMLRDIERRVEARPFEIPHLVAHDRGTALDFITPPDGADA